MWYPKSNDRYGLYARDPYMGLYEIYEELGPDIDNITLAADSSYVMYERLPEEEGELSRIFVFDSDATLESKLERIFQTRDHRGVAFWGLGHFPHNSDDLHWRAIGAVFGEAPSHMAWVIAGYLLFMVFLSFPYAIATSWEIRNVTAKFRKYFFIVVGLGLLSLLASLFCLNIIPRATTGLYISMAIFAIFMSAIMMRRIISRIRRYFRYVRIRI